MRGSAHGARVFFRRSDFRHWRFWYDHRGVLYSGGRDPLFGHYTLTGYTEPLVGLWFAMLGHRLRCCVQIHWAPKIVGPPWKIKLLHSFFKLAEQRAPSFDFPLIVSKFSKCPCQRVRKEFYPPGKRLLLRSPSGAPRGLRETVAATVVATSTASLPRLLAASCGR